MKLSIHRFKMAEEKPKLVRMVDYNGVWAVRHAPNPILNKSGEPIKT